MAPIESIVFISRMVRIADHLISQNEPKLALLARCWKVAMTSFLRLTAMQRLKRKQNLAELAPEPRFILAQTIERVAWQVGQAQETARKVGSWIDRVQIARRL